MRKREILGILLLVISLVILFFSFVVGFYLENHNGENDSNEILIHSDSSTSISIEIPRKGELYEKG